MELVVLLLCQDSRHDLVSIREARISESCTHLRGEARDVTGIRNLPNSTLHGGYEFWWEDRSVTEVLLGSNRTGGIKCGPSLPVITSYRLGCAGLLTPQELTLLSRGGLCMTRVPVIPCRPHASINDLPTIDLFRRRIGYRLTRGAIMLELTPLNVIVRCMLASLGVRSLEDVVDKGRSCSRRDVM